MFGQRDADPGAEPNCNRDGSPESDSDCYRRPEPNADGNGRAQSDADSHRRPESDPDANGSAESNSDACSRLRPFDRSILRERCEKWWHRHLYGDDHADRRL